MRCVGASRSVWLGVLLAVDDARRLWNLIFRTVDDVVRGQDGVDVASVLRRGSGEKRMVDGAGYLDVLGIRNVTRLGQDIDDFGLRRKISGSCVAQLDRDGGWGF